MKQTIAILSAAGVLMLSGSYATVRAQAPAGAKSVTQGVYTAEQAARGKMLYTDNCAACHGDDLAGSGPMPPLGEWCCGNSGSVRSWAPVVPGAGTGRVSSGAPGNVAAPGARVGSASSATAATRSAGTLAPPAPTSCITGA
jgi:mono/diheme cytochrome c family protein